MRHFVLTFCVCSCLIGAEEKTLARADFEGYLNLLRTGKTAREKMQAAERLTVAWTPEQRTQAGPVLLKAVETTSYEAQAACMRALTNATYWNEDHLPILEKFLTAPTLNSSVMKEMSLAFVFLGPKAQPIRPKLLEFFKQQRARGGIPIPLCEALWAVDPAGALPFFKKEYRMGLAYNPQGVDPETMEETLARLLDGSYASSELILTATKISTLGAAQHATVDEILKSKTLDMRRAGLRLLGCMGLTTEQYVERLRAVSTDYSIAAGVMTELGKIGEPARSAEKEILNQFRSADDRTVAAALKTARILKLDVSTKTAEISDALAAYESEAAALQLIESLGAKGQIFLPEIKAAAELKAMTPEALKAAAGLGDDGLAMAVRALNNPRLERDATAVLCSNPNTLRAAPHFAELVANRRHYRIDNLHSILKAHPALAERLGGPLAVGLAKAIAGWRADRQQDRYLAPLLDLAKYFGPQAAPAAPVLVELVGDSNFDNAAFRTLHSIGPAAVPSVLSLLKSKDEKAVKAALFTLNRMGSGARASVPVLAELMDQQNKYAQDVTQALMAMKLQTEEVGPLLPLVLSEDKAVRRGALSVLRNMQSPPKEILEPLFQMAHRGEYESYVTDISLQLGEVAAPHALRLMNSTDVNVRGHGSRLVANMGKKMAPVKNDLLAALKSEFPEIRSGAVKALGAIGDPTTLEAVQALEKDPNADVAAIARSVVAQLRK